MDIIPSTELKVVSVSKLGSLKCLRYYFWKYILNLEQKRMNNAFWYGGVMGAGVEALLMGKPDRQVRAAMKKEDKSRCSRCIIDGDMSDEMRLQRRIIEAIVLGARRQPEVKRMKMKKSQVQFKLKLKCGLVFCGTEDGEGTYGGKECLFENKTKSRPNSAYMESRMFSKQVNGYAYACRKAKRALVPTCRYNIFPKPQKHVKRNQTIDEFVEEIEQDIIERPQMYYIWHSFTLGRTTVSECGHDIERQAAVLKMLYSDCGGKLLDPHKWPKQENKCFDYKGCEYLQLCKNPKKWEQYLRFFQQRQMLYEEENDELE